MRLANLTQALSTAWLMPPQRLSAADEAQIEQHLARILSHAGRVIAFWGIIMIFLFWPTDLLVFRRLPEAIAPFARLRGALLFACLLSLLYLLRRPVVTLQAHLPPVVLWCATVALITYHLGTVGGLDRPWFHFTYAIVFAVMAFPVTFPRRVIYTVVLAASMLGGYCAGAPDSLRSPYLPATCGYLVFVMLASITFGHLIGILIRVNHGQRLELERSAAALAGHNERLASAVEEQSRELRELSQHLGRALEAERARISRELHDELGQQLMALRYEVTFMRQRFARSPASIEKNLEALDQHLGRAATSVRQIATDLRPRLLDDLGVVAAAEWLVQRTAERTGLRCALEIDGEPPEALDGEVATAIFRILQEALTNAARHARAGAVEVALRFAAEGVALDIHDDGVGLSGQGGGMGLLGMRERARALGGTVRIESAPGAGTRVRCHLPAVGKGRTSGAGEERAS